MRKFVMISAALLGLGAAAGCAGNPPVAADSSPDPVTTVAQGESTEPADEPTPEPKPEPEPESDLTFSQEQAVGTADDYLAYSGFSRQGLIEQLEFEGFSEADAEFAVDYLEVNWKEQAVRVAEDYLAYSHFSRRGLIDQLEFEGFTTKQAEHGATEAGL